MCTVTSSNKKASSVTNNAIPISVKTLQKAHFALAVEVCQARRYMRDIASYGNQADIATVTTEFNEVVAAHNEVTRALHSASPGDYAGPVDQALTAVQS